MKRGNADKAIARYVLPLSHWSNHLEWIERLIKKGTADAEIAQYVLSQPYWASHPELVEKLLENGKADANIISYVLSKPYWSKNRDWAQKLIAKLLEKGTSETGRAIAGSILSQPEWSNHPELVEKLIERRDDQVDRKIIDDILSKPFGANHPEWMERMLVRGNEIVDLWDLLREDLWKTNKHWKYLMELYYTPAVKRAEYVNQHSPMMTKTNEGYQIPERKSPPEKSNCLDTVLIEVLHWLGYVGGEKRL